MVPYDAILFDFDGVLADSEALHYACWVEILTPHGIELTWANYQANCIGITDRAMLEVLRHQVDPPYDIDLLWPEYPRKKALFREKAAAHPPIAESTRELILSMAGQPIAVVSPTSDHNNTAPPYEVRKFRRSISPPTTNCDSI